MAVDLELDHGSRVVRSRAWGEVTGDEIACSQPGIQTPFPDGTNDATWAHSE